MAASTYMRVMDQKVIIFMVIYTVGASNEDQALLMNIRKNDMINTINVIRTFALS